MGCPRRLTCILFIVAVLGSSAARGAATTLLPPARTDGAMAVERALAVRRSVRDYVAEPVTLAQAGQILWAAQGITHDRGHRTAPSAGALYPLEIYLVAGVVEGIDAGTWHYDPRRHGLRLVAPGDARARIAAAALDQDWAADAPAILLITAVHARTARKYGVRAPRYVHMEVGHAAQNVYLQAASLGLGTCMVGAFQDERLKEVVGLPDTVKVLGVMPFGKPR